MQQWIRNVTADEYLATLKVGLKLDKEMLIASLGSCFAREIRGYLLGHGFNYMLLEQDKDPWVKIDPHYKPNDHGSAAWDRVFNTFTLRDVVALAFGDTRDRFLKIDQGVADLVRTRVVYPDMDTALKDVEEHQAAARTVFTNADVLIVTLGLTEVWKYGDIVLPYLHDYLSRDKLTFHRSDFTENLLNLSRTWHQLKHYNPKLKLLVTLSPIHMNATFREDVDVFSASCASKSILRAVIDSFCSARKDVYYFPSYEIATVLCPELGVRTYRDGHHISAEAFGLITRAFEGMEKVI